MKKLMIAASLIFVTSAAQAGVYVCQSENGDVIVIKKVGDTEQLVVQVENIVYRCTITDGRKCGYGTHAKNMFGTCPY